MGDTKVNYTEAQIDQLKDLYASGKSVKEIAEVMNRTPRSIQGKLVNLGLYQKVEKEVKVFKDEPTKGEILRVLASKGYSENALKGLEHATKTALQEVVERTASNEAVLGSNTALAA